MDLDRSLGSYLLGTLRSDGGIGLSMMRSATSSRGSSTSMPAKLSGEHGQSLLTLGCFNGATLDDWNDVMLTLRDLSEYRFEGKNEQAVREEWIFPLLLHLGYGPTTLNDVKFGDQLKLRSPLWKLGSKRMEIDYRPTVLGHELWLIEAKAPGAVDADEHLFQAWSYATHPEVNVPLVVLADGAHLAVHDLTAIEWDHPVVDVPVAEVEDRFDEILAILGARTVATAVRHRLLGRLQKALEAELDPDALDDTISRTKEIVERVRPSVLENRRRVADDANLQRERDDQRMLKSVGLWGLAQELNVPFGWRPLDVERGLRALQAQPNVDKLEQLWKAVADGQGHDRAFWGLRTFRLSLSLRARSLPACASVASARSHASVRDHLLGFPDDPTSAAAHRLEIPLFVFALRAVSQPTLGLRQQAERHLAELDVESTLRLGLAANGHHLALSAALLICRRLFACAAWDPISLDARAVAVRRILESFPYDKSFISQYLIGVDVGDDWERHDPLVDFTLLAVAQFGPDLSLSTEETEIVRNNVERQGPVGDAARQLAR